MIGFKNLCYTTMKLHGHLERAIELLQSRLQFGTYKESPYGITLVNKPDSILSGLDRGVIVGYQVTLQPIKVGKFPKPDPEDRTKYVQYIDQKLNRQEKHKKDRDRVDAGKFDEVLDEISQNNDIFTVEEPIHQCDFEYHFDRYIVAIITDIKEPDGSELAKTTQEAILRRNYQRPGRFQTQPWSQAVIKRRLECNLHMLKMLHQPMLLVCDASNKLNYEGARPIKPSWGRICMYHINGMELNILPGSEDHEENVNIQKSKGLTRDWDLLDPLWNDKHPMFRTHSAWEYVLHNSKKANHLVTKRNFYR